MTMQNNLEAYKFVIKCGKRHPYLFDQFFHAMRKHKYGYFPQGNGNKWRKRVSKMRH